MSERGAGALIPPPVVLLGILGVGIGLNFVLPLRFVASLIVQLSSGLSIIALGFSLWSWAIATMRRAGTGVDPNNVVTSLVTEGPFKITRNPLYLGGVIMVGGIAIAVNALWIILLLPIMIVFLVFQVKREEEYLERKFGEDYRLYKARVRRWL